MEARLAPAPVQIRLLVEEGGADVNVRDRWGHTPLDEAQRVGARPCAQYLERRLAAAAAAAAAQDNAARRPPHALTPLEESGGGGGAVRRRR